MYGLQFAGSLMLRFRFLGLVWLCLWLWLGSLVVWSGFGGLYVWWFGLVV